MSMEPDGGKNDRWSPTHRVGDEALPTWELPDAGSRSTAMLDPQLEVVVSARDGSWAQIEASNGWTAWVDGRQLIALTSEGLPLHRDGIDEALDAALNAALDECEAALGEFAADRLDQAGLEEIFRRAGKVQHGTDLWLLDLEHGRWALYDGFSVSFPADIPSGSDVT